MNKHFCKLLLAAGNKKINRTRPFPWKIKNSAWGTDKDKCKYNTQNREVIVTRSSNRTWECIVADREQIRESSLLWVELENFSKVTVEGNILDGVKGVSESVEAGLDLQY